MGAALTPLNRPHVRSLAPDAVKLSVQARADEPRYILFLTADGFRSDYVEWHQPPHIKQAIAEGARVTNAKPVFPTVTTPNMTSLVTGAYPRTTGIACNSQYVREADKIVRGPRTNAAETIAETLHKAGWSTASINHFMLQGRGAQSFVSTGYNDSEKTTDAIIQQLKNKTRFIAAIFGATDSAGHKHGPKSEQVKEAVLGIDRAIGRLISSLRDRESWSKHSSRLIPITGCQPSNRSRSRSRQRRRWLKPVIAWRHRKRSSTPTPKSSYSITVSDSYTSETFWGRPKQGRSHPLTDWRTELLDRAKLDALGCHDNRSGDVIVSPLPGYTMSKAGARADSMDVSRSRIQSCSSAAQASTRCNDQRRANDRHSANVVTTRERRARWDR
jgi:hypothetical protein